MKQYSLDDFNNYCIQGIINPQIKKIILDINIKVSAPNYKKTPNFKKDKHIFFKKTTVKKSPEKLLIENISLMINKLTKDNFDKLKLKLLEKIQTVTDIQISNIFFTALSNNKFFLDILFDLYLFFYEKKIFNDQTHTEFFEKYKKSYDEIKYYNSEENFELFCKNNEKNDKRHIQSCFWIRLYEHKILKEEKMLNLINDLQTKLNELLLDPESTYLSIEITENLFILINKHFEKNNKKNNTMIENINKIITAQKADYPGILNKIKFKHMDIQFL